MKRTKHRNPHPLPKVSLLYFHALQSEFTGPLDTELTLEQVLGDYESWCEDCKTLIDEYGSEATVAEIRQKFESGEIG